MLARQSDGALNRSQIALPDSVKPKRYRQQFRTRFCEGLLSRRVLIAEGTTEATAYPVLCRRLSELNPMEYSSLEALGICTVDAGSETCIADMAKLYTDLGKRVFALCDKQSEESRQRMESHTDILLMHDEDGFEDLVLENTTEGALKRFAATVEWPAHIQSKYSDTETLAKEALREYFCWSKGSSGLSDFLAQCEEQEVPEWLRVSCKTLKEACTPSTKPEDESASTSAPGAEETEQESDSDEGN